MSTNITIQEIKIIRLGRIKPSGTRRFYRSIEIEMESGEITYLQLYAKESSSLEIGSYPIDDVPF